MSWYVDGERVAPEDDPPLASKREAARTLARHEIRVLDFQPAARGMTTSK